MNARDMIALFEYTKNFNTPKKPTARRKKKYDDDEADLVALFLKRQKQADELKKAIENIAKMDKKDEKKDEKKKDGFSMSQIALLLVATFPITAPAYVYYVAQIMKSLP